MKEQLKREQQVLDAKVAAVNSLTINNGRSEKVGLFPSPVHSDPPLDATSFLIELESLCLLEDVSFSISNLFVCSPLREKKKNERKKLSAQPHDIIL